MSEVKCTNLRFNLGKPVQRAAWECLQTMDKAQFKSYSQVIASLSWTTSSGSNARRTIRILKRGSARNSLSIASSPPSKAP